jgi:hypothetical protein
MAKRKNYKNKHNSFQSIWWLVSVLVSVAVILGVLELTHTIHLFHSSKPASETIVTVGKPTPIPKSDVSGSSTSSTKTTTPNNSARTIGGAVDTKGTSTTTTSPSQWVSSASGQITVKQPTANATIQNGSTLSGSASVSQVDYTLIDDNEGVISQGTLNVVNGNFSGILQFAAHSSSGRLDIYSTSSFGGPEQNEIEITVNF